ncbi:MAG: peptide deformylase [Desulfobacteraceae bacterium 4572_19]|nr:MAG: peptide deformylase [Desulfobacteraceae bacterium 4572_19]
MATLDIITYPNQLLSQSAKKVEEIDQTIIELIENMKETMHRFDGVGLAAVQVGINISLFVYNDSKERKIEDDKVLINPTIISNEGEFVSENEGCLSVPEFRANVKRAVTVIVEAEDIDGKPVKIEANGITSVIMQHEIDHLNGVLFINRISALKRNIYKRKVKKELKSK